MMQQKSRNTKARNIFLILFLLSTCLALVFGVFFNFQQLGGGPNAEVLNFAGLVATGTSCLTSIITFIGFVSTTILTWRKEGREKEDRELERKHKEIELEKEKLELEKMKAELEKQSRKKTK